MRRLLRPCTDIEAEEDEHMPARAAPAIRASYPKHWFLLGTMAYIPLVAVMIYLGFDAIEESTRLFWVAIGVTAGVLLSLFFLPPLMTSHLVGERSLRIHMGLLIKADIPFTWVKDVRQTSIKWGGVRIGIGVRYSAISKTAFVTSAFKNLVTIVLDDEHDIGGFLRPKVSTIVLTVDDSAAFMKLLAERISTTTGG